MSDDLEVGKCPYCGGDMIENEDTYCCEDCGYCESRMVFVAERDEKVSIQSSVQGETQKP